MEQNRFTIARGEKFSSLGSAPADWAYKGHCERVWPEVECELCETMICYRHDLVNQANGQVLKIGSECVVKFHEAYQPNGLDIILGMLHTAYTSARKKFVAAKMEAFREQYPALVAFLIDSKDSKTRARRTCFLAVAVEETGTGFDATMIKETIYKPIYTSLLRGNLKRRGYLHQNEIVALTPNVRQWVADKGIHPKELGAMAPAEVVEAVVEAVTPEPFPPNGDEFAGLGDPAGIIYLPN